MSIGRGFIQVNALTHPLAFGAWVPWDALVSNQPGVGDYATISAAVLGENAGAIIAVDSNPGNPYTEIQDIVPQQGQVIFGMDGRDDANGGVVYQMGDFIIDINVDDVEIYGIYWDFNGIATNEAKIQIDGSDNGYIHDCTFDFTTAPAAAHRGIDLNTCNDWTLKDLTVIQSAASLRWLELNTCLRCSVDDIRVTGGDVATDLMVAVIDSGSCDIHNISCGAPDTAPANTYYWHEDDNAGTTLGNTYHNIHIVNDSQGDAVCVENANTQIHNLRISHCQTALAMNGAEQVLDGFSLTGAAGGNGITVNAARCKVSNGDIDDAFVNGIVLAGGRALVDHVNADMTAGGDAISCGASDDNVVVACTSTTGIMSTGGGGNDNRFVACEATGFTDGGNRTQMTMCDFGTAAIAGTDNQRGMRVHVAAADPTVNDDDTDNFLVGVSFWYNSTNDVLWRCDANATGAAVWTQVNGLSGLLYDALVHPTAGVGDYVNVSSACTGEAAGAVIAVAPVAITEVADIVPQEGQVIMSLAYGVEGDDNDCCTVDMQTHIIDVNVSEAVFKGIYFKYDANGPAHDQAWVDIAGNDCVFRDCTFDCTDTAGVQQHRCVLINGVANVRLENINIACDTLTYRPIDMDTAVDAILENVKITGGTQNPTAVTEDTIDMDECYGCILEKIKVSALDTEKATAYMIHDTVSADTVGNTFRDIDLSAAAGAPSSGGIEIQGTGAMRSHPSVLDNVVVNLNANNGEIAIDLVSDARVVNSDFVLLTIDGSTNHVSSTRMTTLNIGVTSTADDNTLHGVEVTGTFTNGANAERTTIAACTFGTFTDNDTTGTTIRDILTQETVAAAYNVRGYREYNNTGAGGLVNGTLPPAVMGIIVRIVVMAAQNFRLTAAAGDQIHLNGLSSVAGGTVTSNVLYSTLTLRAMDATNWVASSASGGFVVV